MKLLLTNDDGVMNPGIHVLARTMQNEGHDVVIVAPDGERSASSHAISWGRPITAKAVELEGIEAYACSGTPADCTRLGLNVFCKDADFVVSGVNAGVNTGKDTIYSGTVAAALEGALQGVPAMAVSQEWSKRMEYASAAQWAARMLAHFEKHPMPQGTICNLNAPNLPFTQIKGIRLADLNNDAVKAQFDRYDGKGMGVWYFLNARTWYDYETGSDRAYLKEGYATVTYMSWRLQTTTPEHPLPTV